MTTTRRRAPSPGRRPSSPAPLTPDNVQAPYMKPSLVIPLLCFLLQQALAFYVGLSPAESGAPPSVLAQALRRALAGGIGGAIGGAIQVLTMMWLRTAMNVQYRDGGSLSHTLRSLYKEGGVPRFYRGLTFALLQNPLSRFGDTFANVGVLAVFLSAAPHVPLGLQTALASACGSIWRVAITPLDTLKTTLQVSGAGGYDLLLSRVKTAGVGTLWNGALANASASFVGSFPWFFTFNLLDEHLPPFNVLLRAAVMGCVATAVSDVVSNSLRVVKTLKQTASSQISYREAARRVVAQDGWRGLFLRGLSTRIIANTIQSMIFSVMWKFVEASIA